MEWEGREESPNVEDRRGLTSGGAVVGGGGLLFLILALLFGGNLPQGARNREKDPREDELKKFSGVVLGDTERVWGDLFQKMGKRYRAPKMVLYEGGTQTACGFGQAVMGPFYCPADSTIYLDLSFYREMEQKLKAKGEFARAYVIAHEVGHHVQRLLGYSQRVDEQRGRVSKVEANRLSVRLELQADFLAGVWAHHGEKKYRFLEEGDLESAVNAASQIGDDKLQKQSQGYVVPEKFTHGTSKQRMRWFMEGFKTGDVNKAAELFELPYDKL